MLVELALSNQSQFMAEQKRKMVNLKKQKSTTNTRIARFLQTRARMMAPYKTGKLAESIKITPLTNGDRSVRVTRVAEGGFPYPKWVNQDPGFVIISYSKGAWLSPDKSYSGRWAMIAPPGTKAVYGGNPSHWRWTGTPGFFRIAIRETNKYFQHTVAKEYNAALGARVGGA